MRGKNKCKTTLRGIHIFPWSIKHSSDCLHFVNVALPRAFTYDILYVSFTLTLSR